MMCLNNFQTIEPILTVQTSSDTYHDAKYNHQSPENPIQYEINIVRNLFPIQANNHRDCKPPDTGTCKDTTYQLDILSHRFITANSEHGKYYHKR